MTNVGQDFAQQKAMAERDPENHNPFHQYINADASLSGVGVVTVGAGVAVLTKAIHQYATDKGWWPEVKTDRNFGEVLALIHSEVTETLEEYRNDEPFDEISYSYPNIGLGRSDQEFIPDPNNSGEVILGKPEGIASEMADIVIRVLDACAAYNIPIGDALVQKHRYNITRAYRHGNKKA